MAMGAVFQLLIVANKLCLSHSPFANGNYFYLDFHKQLIDNDSYLDYCKEVPVNMSCASSSALDDVADNML